ncbi:MAG: hypothetical protein LAO56_11280 [Acidobacteriia bacterium]|jgi:hypothetical protein|nr:hypothetical protein [Terriglobia bacterium]
MKRQKLWAMLIILMVAGLFACSGRGTSKAQKEPKRVFKEANDLAENDAKRPRLELSPPEPKLEMIASEGECAPKSQNELAVASCYKNVACRGQWARAEKGGPVECWCFAKKGGCDEGTICCAASRACEKPENCYVP